VAGAADVSVRAPPIGAFRRHVDRIDGLTPETLESFAAFPTPKAIV
jgi:hypothetical protein